ncbi:MAG TPA: glycosyltransferase family 4 protein [Flavobacterium sp.]|nr:glycosyltransferase family 4 protein [Flavobacterium sp.]
MKILHISGAKGWGGNEQQMIDLIPELTNLGVNNIVFGVENSQLQKQCESKSISFTRAKTGKLNKLANYSYLKTIVKELQPDLIHLHTSDSLTVFTISDLIFGLKVKTVFSKKGMGVSGSFLSKFKYNYSGVNSIFCVSRSVEKDFSKILYEKNKFKTTVIHDCVSLDIVNPKEILDLREKFNINKDCYIIGNIANHTRAKDLDTFINVVEYVVNKLGRKDVVFLQIGEFSKLTGNLVEIVKEKKLENSIVFAGKIENASSLNTQFDVFLMTSQREGGPTSVLEAMLIGVPIVSTNVGVVPDVIENGSNGFIAPIKDYKDLATKIDLLLSDKNLQRKFILESRSKIEKEFIVSKIAIQTLTEYERILNL